jgi:hypothetical protein
MNKLFLTLLTIILFLLFISACSTLDKRESKYDNGQPKELFYVKKDSNGNYVKNGSYTSYFEDGQLKEKGIFKDGKENGLYIKWADGPLRVLFSKWEFVYQDGKILKSTVWDVKGHKQRECVFNGADDTIGTCTEWDENGQIKEEWTEEEKRKIISHFENGLKGSTCYRVGILSCLTINGVSKSALKDFLGMVARTSPEELRGCKEEWNTSIDLFFGQDKAVGMIEIQKLIEEGYLK